MNYWREKMGKADLDWEDLSFGYVKTDYNIRYIFRDGAWSTGELVQDDSLNVHIAAPALHYGQQCFEGLKAFETKDGNIVVFRPEENAKRLNRSCDSMLFPDLPEDLFLDAIKKVVAANSRFVPPYGTGASLYIRPLVLGMGPKVGLGEAVEYMFMIFVTPVGPYYKSGFTPVKALVVDCYDRAAPRGVGQYKVGGNYAAGMRGQHHGKEKGYPIVLYLDAREKKYINEFGTSNFIAIKDKTYLTPESDSILPSITNKSLMQLAEHLGYGSERRPISVSELETFDEAGAVGTATVITPVSEIHYKGTDYHFGESDKAGPIITELYDTFQNIQTGVVEDTFNWLLHI